MDDWVAFTGPFYELLKPRARLKKRKRLPGPGNPVNVKEERSRMVPGKLLDILGRNDIVKLPLLCI